MTLDELIRGLPIALTRGSPQTTVTQIVEDSRQAMGGCLFIARSGTKEDGRRYIEDAVKAGAAAVLCDDASLVPANAAALQTEDPAWAGAILAERFHGHPSRKLALIGVTGTNGKTTTTYLIQQSLNRAGMRCGLIGTVRIDDGAKKAAANLTTPPSIEISRLLASMVSNGCRACVMETSSHALHQKRTAGLNFHIGVFTNLTGDHLDYHQSMDAYRSAKAILFESLPNGGCAVLNMDDESAAKLKARLDPGVKVIQCSLSNDQATCFADVGRQTLSHIETHFAGAWGEFDCKLPLIGAHNVMNALQALAVCHVMGVNRRDLQAGMSSCTAPPGRLEPVTNPADPFAVLVDYAHTDDALENVLKALKPVVPACGKLRVVFGCGGDRDRTKRPRMARVAWRHADDVTITSDNPRTEHPEAIIDEILSGVPGNRLDATHCEVDRARAINAAVKRLRAGDMLLIAGKGHEDYQIIGTTKRPFDDRLVAKAALEEHADRRHIAAA